MHRGLREEEGLDADALFNKYLRAYNDGSKGRPEGLEVAIHLCRGNSSTNMHFSESSCERVARKLFNELDHDTFNLEDDSPRAGGFEPLQSLPANKNVVLGAISSGIKRKVYEAADILVQGWGRTTDEVWENIGISPQCGFASAGGRGQEEVMIAKLRLVRDVAKELWPEKK